MKIVKRLKSFIARNKYKLGIVIALSLVFSLLPFNIQINLIPGDNEKVIYIGMEDDVYAAGVADYTCDGAADHVQAQAALDALPAGGGKLVFLTGNYSFGATVTRAIDNVEIQGNGYATYFANNGATALFSAGTQDRWIFRDFRTDAGGITEGGADYWVMENVWEGATYWQLRVDSNIVSTNYDIPFVDISGTPTNDQVAIWVDADTLEGSNATIGGITIAASNSSASDKVAATLTGGTICSGANDEEDLKAAIAIADNTGSTVNMAAGDYYFDEAADIVIDDCIVRGAGTDLWGNTGTRIHLTDNADTLRVLPGGKLQNVRVVFPNAYTGDAVEVGPDQTGDADDKIFDREFDVLKNVYVQAVSYTNRTGTAVKINVTSTSSDTYMELCSFGDIVCGGAEYGLVLYCEEDAGRSAYLNSNVFNYVLVFETTYQIYFDTAGTGTPHINANLFQTAITHGSDALNVQHGLYFEDGANENIFPCFFAWDVTEFQDYIIETEDDANMNVVEGSFGGVDADATEFWKDNAIDYASYGPANRIMEQLGQTTIRFNYEALGPGEYSGEITYGKAKEALAEGDLCVNYGYGWYQADADSVTYAIGDLAICCDGLSSETWGVFLVYGYAGGFSFSPGYNPVYMSTTDGDVTQTAPSGDGDVVRIVGYAGRDSSSLWFEPDSTYYVVDASGQIASADGIRIAPYNDIENITANHTIVAADSGRIFTNKGDVDTQLQTLPTNPTAGLTFTFVLMAAQRVEIEVAEAADIFYAEGAITTDDGGGDLYIWADDEGESITLVAYSATEWIVANAYGTWTVTQR